MGESSAPWSSPTGWEGAIPPLGGRLPAGVADDAEGGLRRQPELGFPDGAEPPPVILQQDPPDFHEDADAETAAAARLRSRVRQAARQASLDPDDGIPL